MTVDEIKATLATASKLRMPRWDPTSPLGAQDKIEKLEEHLVNCSYHRAELEEADLHLSSAVHRLRVEWETLEGYEAGLGKVDPDKATGPQHQRAKRLHRPDLFTEISDGKHLLDRVARQIRRLEHDEDVASRAYTMITGG